jgi:hypothetical protein
MEGTVGVAGWVGLGVYGAEGLAERGVWPSTRSTPPGELPGGISMYAFAREENRQVHKHNGSISYIIHYVVYTVEPLSKKDITETRTPLYEGSLKEELYMQVCSILHHVTRFLKQCEIRYDCSVFSRYAVHM